MKIVAISDVHNKWDNLVVPECDLLISAGDYSFVGEQSVIRNFHAWLSKQPAKHKISLQGNHEVWVQEHFNFARQIAEENCPGVHFIDEGPLEIEGIKIWCSAVTPWFHAWAWNRHRGPEIQKHWNRIPIDTELLITHGPPYGILDQVKDAKGNPITENLGCKDLRARLGFLDDLKLHVFGHIHTGSGYERFGGVDFINASVCDEAYRPVNQPRIYEWKQPDSVEKQCTK